MKLLLPVGGRGTRLLPLTKAVPKEMLPLADKPILQHLLEDGYKADLDGAVVIISPDKKQIKNYFTPDPQLEEAIGRDKAAPLRELDKFVSKFPIEWATQKYPRGDGDALLCGKRKLGFWSQPCAVVFGDSLFDAKPNQPVLKAMLKLYEKTGSTVVGVKKVPKNEVSRFGIVGVEKIKRGLLVREIVEKPKEKDAPSDLALTGIYILSKGIWKALKKATRSKDGELRLADGLIKLLETEEIYAYSIPEPWLDTGTMAKYVHANHVLTKKHKTLGKQLN